MDDHSDVRAQILEAVERLEAAVVINGRARTLLTRRAAASSMGVSLAHFDRYVRHHVPFVQIGSSILFRPVDLERWASRQVQGPGVHGRRS